MHCRVSIGVSFLSAASEDDGEADPPADTVDHCASEPAFVPRVVLVPEEGDCQQVRGGEQAERAGGELQGPRPQDGGDDGGALADRAGDDFDGDNKRAHAVGDSSHDRLVAQS